MAMDPDHKDDDPRNRRNKRALVLIAAKVRTAADVVDVRLRNLSRNGALLEADKLPDVGSEVTFERGDTVVSARVAWAEGGRFGIEFLHPIEESEVLVHIGRPSGFRAPVPSPVVRRTGFRGGSLSPAEREMAAAWVNPSGRALGD